MTEREQVRWEAPGYSEIVAVRQQGADLVFEFADGEVVVAPAATFGITAREFTIHVDPDDPLSARVNMPDGGSTVLSWLRIRVATDADFAQEMRRRDTEQSRRLGLRLRALREDKNLSQRDLAAVVGMSPPQLSKIESGTFDLRVSTVQSLLRGMGATLADVASPDAPEISQRALRKKIEVAGVARDLAERLFAGCSRTSMIRLVAHGFGWTRELLVEGEPAALRVASALFKARTGYEGGGPGLRLAQTLGDAVLRQHNLPSFALDSADVSAIRGRARDATGKVTLASLAGWMWAAGIPVLPLHGSGEFYAAVWSQDDRPIVVLKDQRELAAFWLFDLAHELGHVVHGHVDARGVVEIDPPKPVDTTDDLEAEANRFALELLLPNHHGLLAEVRTETRGDYMRFKGAVATVAKKRNVSVGMLGLVAAYEMIDVGQNKDRWGSASNLAKAEGPGRSVVQKIARSFIDLDGLDEVDSALLEAAALSA